MPRARWCTTTELKSQNLETSQKKRGVEKRPKVTNTKDWKKAVTEEQGTPVPRHPEDQEKRVSRMKVLSSQLGTEKCSQESSTQSHRWPYPEYFPVGKHPLEWIEKLLDFREAESGFSTCTLFVINNLGYCAWNNWCFWTVVLEKIL